MAEVSVCTIVACVDAENPLSDFRRNARPFFPERRDASSFSRRWLRSLFFSSPASLSCSDGAYICSSVQLCVRRRDMLLCTRLCLPQASGHLRVILLCREKVRL